jgi:hypothetical protein
MPSGLRQRGYRRKAPAGAREEDFMTLRLLQHRSDGGERSVIAARDDAAHVVPGFATIRALALHAIAQGKGLAQAVEEAGRGDSIDIAGEYAAGRFLAPIDHEDDAHVLMTGTGLTHLGSAEGRDKMHREAAAAEKQTDSMRMFLEGLEGG